MIDRCSNNKYSNREEISYRNWQAYEIAKNYEKENGLVVAKLESSYKVPDEVHGISAEWVYSFNLEYILDALSKLAK